MRGTGLNSGDTVVRQTDMVSELWEREGFKDAIGTN